MIKTEIVGHSLSPQGDELISVLCTFPRIILAEVNTHRMLSKNTSSSRAIPFHKMVKAVQENPFIPIAWQKEHKGMQGSKYITEDVYIKEAIANWLASRDNAIKQAEYLNKTCQVTKQLCNRLLEPFMWTTMLITGSKEGWDNFFNLRLPSYVYGDERGHYALFNSRKEYIDFCGEDIQYIPESEVGWLSINKGQAEIHIMDLAEKIYDAVNESTPKQLQAGEWHIPMISDSESLKLSTNDQIKLSVGRAANTSYTVVGDGKELTLEHAIKIHDKCVELVHSSVFEHCARAMSDEEYKVFIKGKNIGTIAPYLFDDTSKGWCNNIKGFMLYRYFIDNKIEI